MSQPKLEYQKDEFPSGIPLGQKITEEYEPQVGAQQRGLTFEVDPETKVILVEEAARLTERLNRICIQLKRAEPDRRTALNVLASYLQINVIELRAYLSQS